MVGKRPRSSQNGNITGSKPDDLESAITSSRRPPRFRDAVNLAMQNDFHQQLKRKLQQSPPMRDITQYRKSQSELKEMKKRGVKKETREFYERQNEKITDWLEVDMLVNAMAEDVLDSMNPKDLDGDGVVDTGGAFQRSGESVEQLLPDDEKEQRRKDEQSAKWAININVIANIVLLAAKAFAAFFSSSLSLIASLVDSALDLLCTLIVWTTNKLVSWRIRRLAHKFPVGRRRLEPLGILVFSIIMIVSFLQILQESVKKLTPGGPHKAEALPPSAIGALAATVVIKGIIGIGSVRIKTTQVQALAQGTYLYLPFSILPFHQTVLNPILFPPTTSPLTQGNLFYTDCKTDVIFNTLSLLFPLLGHLLSLWWLDPLGAALLSLFIIYDWSDTCIQNIARLTGSAVSDRILQKVLLLAWRFAPVVEGYKTLTAYHAGDGVWVEVDVIMKEGEKVGRAHDVAETLQYCLEGLREVDRAFVSVDYSAQGPTGHARE